MGIINNIISLTMTHIKRSATYNEVWSYGKDDGTFRFVINEGGIVNTYTLINLVCIDWYGGYPMPGVKLGEARNRPYYTEKEINKDGLYTEAKFIDKWKNGEITIYDNDGIV